MVKCTCFKTQAAEIVELDAGERDPGIERQIGSTNAVEQQTVEAGVVLEEKQNSRKHRQLRWAGQYEEDWEILLYELGGLWEACFFKWGFYHEHAFGSSLDDARRKAEVRIDSIEDGCLELVEEAGLRFSGASKRVIVDVTGGHVEDYESRMRIALARQ